MARIAVISDSHGRIDNLDFFTERIGQADSLFFLGDTVEDAPKIANRLNTGYVAVRGNCDYRFDISTERIVTWHKHRILLVHGHLFSSPLALFYKAKAENCSVVCFGHTHVPCMESKDGILLLNPGSLSRPRSADGPSCAVLTVTEERVSAEVLLR